MISTGEEASPTHVETCVVIPCFNEEHRLDTERFVEFLQTPHGPRLLFVDDGSRDRTFDVLTTLCRVNPDRAAVLHCASNRGKAEAVRKGILHLFEGSAPVLVGFWDADLATPLTSIATFIDILDQNAYLEMVFGARVKLLGRHVERRAIRHYLGRIFATVVSTALQLPIYDTQCGAKLFRADRTLQAVFAEPFLSKWVFDVEILARYLRIYRRTGRQLETAIYEYPLESWVDIQGSKVRPRDFFRAFADVLAIWLKYRK